VIETKKSFIGEEQKLLATKKKNINKLEKDIDEVNIHNKVYLP